MGDVMGIIFSGVSLLFTVLGFAYLLGKFSSKFDSMEVRVKEDREKNAAQHESFYDMKYKQVETDGVVTRLVEDLTEIKRDIKKLLSRGVKADNEEE